MEIKRCYYGTTKLGEEVELFTLTSSEIEIEIINYGGIIRKVMVPDRDEKMENVVLSYDNLAEYEINPGYFGCITGRVAGRVRGGKLVIGDTLYQLEINNGGNNLHGGIDSLNKKVWSAETFQGDDEVKLVLKYTSEHMENFFPGKVEFIVSYTLKGRSLTIEYVGVPDRETYMSLTNHTSFNLSGDYKRDILTQEIMVDADSFLAVDEETLPVGEVQMENTVFDLREFTKFEKFIKSGDSQIEIVNEGIDHGFILNGDSEKREEHFSCAARDEKSGRELKVITDQPAMVLYTGNYLDATGELLGGTIGRKHLGFCLETQDYPDVFNSFPERAKIYSPENIYRQKTTFIF